jgi:hypothetical protein
MAAFEGGGVRGQPPPVQMPVVPVGHAHVTAKSMQYSSSVNISEKQMPVGQSLWSRQGSQPLPVPWQLPNRCEHVGLPIASSVKRQVAADPHGQELMLSSQSTVQIFSPEKSFAQTWFRKPEQSVSVSQDAQNSRRLQTRFVNVAGPHS